MKRLRLLFLTILCVVLSACSVQQDTPERTLALDAPREYSTLRWPNTVLSSLLPQPGSVRGEVAWEDETGLGIYVADIQPEAFDAYAESCWSSGFSVKYHKADHQYEAYNLQGYHLILDYDGSDVMLIRLEAPPGAAEAATTAPVLAEAHATDTTEIPSDPSHNTEPPASEAPQSATYVLNKSSKKFHLPTCSSVADIKDKNREDFYGSREELIEKGYEPCKRCNP